MLGPCSMPTTVTSDLPACPNICPSGIGSIGVRAGNAECRPERRTVRCYLTRPSSGWPCNRRSLWLAGLERRTTQRLRDRYERLRTNARAAFWNGAFFAENTRDPGYGSRLGNAYAVLAGFPEPAEREGLNALLATDTLADCSFFGYYFVRQALWETGGCDLQRELQPWFEMLNYGLTTWAEDTTYWRSLSHGWSSNPSIDFFTRVLGVTALEPGFRKARIQPAIGHFSSFSGAVATPHGFIRVAWDSATGHLDVEVPPGVNARLELGDEQVDGRLGEDPTRSRRGNPAEPDQRRWLHDT